MSKNYYITDNPRPVSQDFPTLKDKGLSYIHKHMDNNWTNLNPSDPGVTILDQLCYALTELGYCNDFPIKDILTSRDGKLLIEDQFYLPEHILTTAPVTANDLVKYIVDGVEGVNNLVIVTDTAKGSGIYRLYLLIDSSITDLKEIDDTCTAAFICANKARNLGEIFADTVLPLSKAPWRVQGKLVVKDSTRLLPVLSAIQVAINDYIFPKLTGKGYDRLAENGIDTDEIFNGPLLGQGWIPDSCLVAKKNKLRSTELARVISAVPGVVSVSNVCFSKPGTPGVVYSVSCSQTEILFIDLIASLRFWPGSLQSDTLSVWCNGKPVGDSLLPDSLVTDYTGAAPNILYGASVKQQTVLPKGKFRDINTYYSIQHTFPEIFRVGLDAIASNETDFQVAQSRQLKGYLTLFDQVLANQFSQLAQLGQLFSFKNATTGTPSDRHNYYAQMDAEQLANPKYPVPFRDFSPTYFYQSIYKVPNIRPLLKNNDSFKFGLDPDETDLVLVNESWLQYQRDPYNSYIKGLMDFMEEEKINLNRRNEILDHLLARHGESPLMIDTLISGSLYAGRIMKDRVIFKSLYLQNLGLLSYFRQKGHNFMGAGRITRHTPHVSKGFEDRILGWDSTDMLVDTEKIDRAEKLLEKDFINYAAIELKLCLLFGLKALYKNFIAHLFGIGDHRSPEIRTAMWMIEHRRGFIFLETALLNHYAGSTTGTGTETGDPTAATTPLQANELIFIFPSFISTLQTPEFTSRLDFFLQNETPVRLTYQYYFLDAEQLEITIHAFSEWHNCLVYNNSEHMFNQWLTQSANALIELINGLEKPKK